MLQKMLFSRNKTIIEVFFAIFISSTIGLNATFAQWRRKVKIVALVFTPLLPPDRLCCRGGLIMKKKEIVNVLLYNTRGATGIRCVREFCPGF